MQTSPEDTEFQELSFIIAEGAKCCVHFGEKFGMSFQS